VICFFSTKLDGQVSAVDVTDDYFAEKQEVLPAGIVPRFTRGDWCMKAGFSKVYRGDPG